MNDEVLNTLTPELCDAQNPWHPNEWCERPMGHDGPHGAWKPTDDEGGA